MKNEAFRQELVVEYVCDHEERTSASQTRFVFWSNVHRPLGPNIFKMFESMFESLSQWDDSEFT